ncbi:MAG TPA: ferrochelatase [Lacipirellulaceae bacterium]|nr:ferrochelatase [Lacipirellulaceae bacterium]
MPTPYDALLIVSFGGPDRPDDVRPFLENVLRGRNVPHQRMLEVVEHYYQMGGRSPINDQNRALIAALEKELAEHGLHFPIYWGNRNWHPLLADTLRRMAADGVRRALAFVTSAYSSYSSCRQYRENIAAAQAEVGSSAPQVEKLRAFFNHPGFIEPLVENTRSAIEQIPPERRQNAELIFTAHSIPTAMAASCRYEEQLREACRLVAEGLTSSLSLRERAGVRVPWSLVYQSRSGPPQQPWLEPDVGDYLQSRHQQSPIRDVVIVPIGFISDHMEVVYDLDTELRQLCDRLGINMVRAATVGTHPRFIRMIRELIEERLTDSPQRLALGTLGPSHDVCPDDCCLYAPVRPPAGNYNK